MAEWKVHDDNWLVRQEQIAEDRWLLCFIASPKRIVSSLPEGWVNVLNSEWGTVTSVNQYIEEYCLAQTGPLELECLAREMRKKYGSG